MIALAADGRELCGWFVGIEKTEAGLKLLIQAFVFPFICGLNPEDRLMETGTEMFRDEQETVETGRRCWFILRGLLHLPFNVKLNDDKAEERRTDEVKCYQTLGL